MTKEDALAEKDRLEKELANVEKNQTVSNDQSIQWFESCVQTFDYACHARFWFKEGAKEQKRAIFTALGSNLTLIDKKLSINFTYPLEEFKHLIELVPEIKGEFEPKKLIGKTTAKSPFEEKIPSLLRSQNAIRTYFLKAENPVCFPCFNDIL